MREPTAINPLLARRATVLAAAILLATAHLASAEDQIIRRGVDAPQRGEITGYTSTEVTLKPPLNKPEEKISANEVVRVRWDGEPPELNLARSAEDTNRLEEALAEYEKIAAAPTTKDADLKADVRFLIARTLAKMALADPARIEQARTALESFRRVHANHFRDYEAVDYLGRLALAAEDYAAAEAAFAELAGAPWPETKAAATIAHSRVLLAKGDAEQALSAVNGVIESAGDDPLLAARRYEAMLQKSAILEKQQQTEEAAAVLDEVVKLLPTDDARLQAEAYLRLGALRQAQGRQKEAVLAYLHVDVLFDTERASHAEALYHLSHLWQSVGHPDRAADASARLREAYPDSPWTAKLGG